MLFIGTHDAAILTGGTETVQDLPGLQHDHDRQGQRHDPVRWTGNKFDAGAGHNYLDDSGSANTIVMPGAGKGMDDIFGYVLQNGDKLDFRAQRHGLRWQGGGRWQVPSRRHEQQ